MSGVGRAVRSLRVLRRDRQSHLQDTHTPCRVVLISLPYGRHRLSLQASHRPCTALLVHLETALSPAYPPLSTNNFGREFEF